MFSESYLINTGVLIHSNIVVLGGQIFTYHRVGSMTSDFSPVAREMHPCNRHETLAREINVKMQPNPEADLIV